VIVRGVRLKRREHSWINIPIEKEDRRGDATPPITEYHLKSIGEDVSVK
jgi:hypothetical protein